jgi:hypothetical protein
MYEHIQSAFIRSFLKGDIAADLKNANDALRITRDALNADHRNEEISAKMLRYRTASFRAAEDALYNFSNPRQCRACLEEYWCAG